jgi:protein phosphatase
MRLPHAPWLDFAGLSDIGSVREENQDSIRLPAPGLPPERGLLYVLADGMGGLAQGKLASTLAADAMFESFYSAMRPIPRSLGQSVELANTRVLGAAQGAGSTRMGTTLTAVCILGEEMWVAHVGDSRVYLVRDGAASLLTNDHTAVGDLVRMKLLSPDKVRTHAQRSMLNRAVGLGLFVRPDLTKTRLREGDSVVICSDGLWSVVEDGELGEMATASSEPETLCAYLVDEAIARGSDDNVSVIAVRVSRRPPGGGDGPAPGLPRKGPLKSFFTRKAPTILRPSSADIDSPRKERA